MKTNDDIVKQLEQIARSLQLIQSDIREIKHDVDAIHASQL